MVAAYKRALEIEPASPFLHTHLGLAYMLHNEVPHWARQYARHVILLEEQGRLDDQNPTYHKYDTDYHLTAPKGVRHFLVVSLIVAVCLGGGLLLADMATSKSTSILPPYFDDRNAPAKR